ncbi:TraR/DksA C4-type zinc finger protein [Candidatus Desantisbacteria bacterium]|nr:TraR/DksA C4-type zinc finger protein [Candidatus Desantisbacteria bacterium]
MEKEKLDLYRKNLIELRESHAMEKKELEADYLHGSQKEESGDLSAYSLHLADLAADTNEKEKNIRILSTLSDTLFEIDEALYRIEYGNYGICEECGKEIPVARLDAIPYAHFCIECKKAKGKGNNK